MLGRGSLTLFLAVLLNEFQTRLTYFSIAADAIFFYIVRVGFEMKTKKPAPAIFHFNLLAKFALKYVIGNWSIT